MHIYDEANIKTAKDVRDILASIKEEEVGFLNDFDIPYVTIKGPKYPKLRRKTRKLRSDDEDGSDDEDEDEEEGEGDEDDDEEKEDDDDE